MTVFDLIYTILSIIISPFILLRILINPTFRRDLKVRLFGDYSQAGFSKTQSGKKIWVHAASSGEVSLALKLITELNNGTTGYEFFLTTNRLPGLEVAQKADGIAAFMAPLDFSFLVNKFIRATGVEDLIVIETEIWPNMIRLMSRRGKVVIANGRISDHTIKRYKLGSLLLENVFRRVSWVLAKEPESASRFVQLGVPPQKVVYLGNLKFELPVSPSQNELDRLATRFKLDGSQFLFIAGSIQPEETKILVMAWQSLKAEIPGIKLFLVPRHPDKREEFENILNQLSVPYLLSSKDLTDSKRTRENQVFIVDEFGALLCLYALGNSIFVGGSLCDFGMRGGQNMLEPVGLKKPVCVGPYTANFKQEVDILLQVESIRIVKNEAELSDFILECYQKPERISLMGERGHREIIEQAGGLEKNVQKLREIFDPAD